MRAAVIYGAGDVRVEDVPDPAIQDPTDAVVRVVRTCICGSDLHPYRSLKPRDRALRIGHEFLGVVEATGADVSGISTGDVVVAPFAFSDGSCEYCAAGLHTSCRNGGFFGQGGADGGQGEAVRVPYADANLVSLPVAETDDEVLPGLLTLADVYPTGHHAAVTAGVGPDTSVTVVGDGAVGLCAVIAARRLGAEQIILMGRHTDRTDLGREFGATDVVPERGEEGIEAVRELTGGHGTHTVLECVGHMPALEQAFGVVRDGGAVSRVGVPQYREGPIGAGVFVRNITLTGGVAPARAYMEELLPEVLDGTLQPGRVFDRTIGLDGVPDGYRAMDSRDALKVMVAP
jgi:threonine dehydrogenase-like Zn-dependent dehydrogenase